MRGAYLEVLGDLLGSFAVIAAAVVILPRAWHLLRDVVDVLLEAPTRCWTN